MGIEDKKINFNELLAEYETVAGSVDIKKLEDSNKVLDSDIELRRREVANLEARLGDLEKILSEADEKDYAQRKQTTDDLVKVSELKEKKEKEIIEMTAKRDVQKNKIDKVRNAEKNTVKKATKMVDARRAIIEREIETIKAKAEEDIKKLNERKEKFGKVLGAGKTEKQITPEEKIVIEKLNTEIEKIKHTRDEKISGLQKEIELNDKELKKFKIELKRIKLGIKDKTSVKEAKAAETKPEEKKPEEKKQEETEKGDNENAAETGRDDSADDLGGNGATDGPEKNDGFFYPAGEIGDDSADDLGGNGATDGPEKNDGFFYPAGEIGDDSAEETEKILAGNTPIIESINIEPGKYTIRYKDAGIISYSNKDGIADRKFDMEFDRESEQEYRKEIKAKYPYYLNEESLKKLDLGLIKILAEINPDLCKTYIESVEVGEKQEGLPDITYSNSTNDKVTKREAYVTRRNARNNSEIAINNIKSNWRTRIADFFHEKADNIRDWFDARRETKALTGISSNNPEQTLGNRQEEESQGRSELIQGLRDGAPDLDAQSDYAKKKSGQGLSNEEIAEIVAAISDGDIRSDDNR